MGKIRWLRRDRRKIKGGDLPPPAWRGHPARRDFCVTGNCPVTQKKLRPGISGPQSLCFVEMFSLHVLAAESTTAAATAAQKKDDPDEITSVASAAATAAVTSAAASAAASETAAAAAAQNQDQPDKVASTSSIVAFTATSTSTICCCQITHICSSK